MPILLIAAIKGIVMAISLIYSEAFVYNFSSKKIAVLGARGAGKTTLLTWLTALDREALETQQTRQSEKTRASSIDLYSGSKKTTMRFAATIDLPGSEEYRDNGKWKQSLKDSEIILYIVHAGALLRGIDKSNPLNSEGRNEEIKQAIEKRIKDDLFNIQQWVQEEKMNSTSIFIIGNHFDEIDKNFNADDKIDVYENEFKNNDIINSLGKGMIKIIGSLKKRNTMEDIFKQIKKEMDTK